MEPLAYERYRIAAIHCGRDHTLALLDSGKVLGWGGDGSGRIVVDSTEYCSTSNTSIDVVELNTQYPLTSIAAGYGVSLGITASNRVAVWGANAAGIGGRLASVAPATPQLLADLEGIVAIAAGEFLFGAIDAGGTVHTWGLNADVALGRPTKHLNATPGSVAAVPPARLLAIGRGHMLALTRGGRLYAWGNNAAGQLGLGHLEPVASPQPLALDEHIQSVAAGATHTLAMTANGDVLAWGSNHRGQLGRRISGYATVPSKVDLPERVQAIAGGMHYSLALGESGNVYAWGWNARGQLGLDDTEDRHALVRVPGLPDVRQIAAGETHAVALTSLGLFGWGNNAGGQIGALSRRQLRPAHFLLVSRPRYDRSHGQFPIFTSRFSALRMDARRRARVADGCAWLQRRWRASRSAPRRNLRRAAHAAIGRRSCSMSRCSSRTCRRCSTARR